MYGSKPLRAVIILSLICMLAIFVIEEADMQMSDSHFIKYEISADAIDINTATKEELKTLDGVGDAVAENIIKFRTQTRPFERAEDLLLVNRFGEKLLEQNKTKIKVKK